MPETWTASWAWALPLIVLTVVMHSGGLMLLSRGIFLRLRPWTAVRRPGLVFATRIGGAALLVTALHAIEASAWAAAYRLLGALPDVHDATLFSLNAMTTFGHVDFELARHWQMMGPLEALNGVILFGLSTAFLFSVIQDLRPPRPEGARHPRSQ